jgi:ubiquinone biosynthesis protein
VWWHTGWVPNLLGAFLGLLFGMLFIRLMASLSGRLLGVQQSWWRTLLVGVLGTPVGVSFALTIGAQQLHNVGTPLIFFVSILTATMLCSGTFELIALPVRTERAARRDLALPNPARALRRRLSRWARSLQIIEIAARYGLSPYLGGWRGTRARGARPWQALRAALEEAGGAFIKVGQMLSTRPDLLPPDAIKALAGLQDAVAPAPKEAIEALLTDELGAHPATAFARFDPAPLAAASIAQVHRARLTSGEEVVVKIQRPGIRQPIERDLDILLRMARSLEVRAAWARAFGVLSLAEGFAASLREELDFRVEARNTATVAAALDPPESRQARPVVRIPRVYPQLSTSRVLVVEWLDGVNVRDACPLLEELGVSRLTLARELLRSLLRQIMREGTFHADPHPGNVLVLRDGHAALIDFGAVGRLDALQQAALQRMLIALDRRDAAMLCDALLDIAQRPRVVDQERLERGLAHLLAQRLGPGMAPGAELFADLFALLLDFDLSFPPVLGGAFRALVTLQGTLALLAPEFPMIDEARALGAEWVQASIAPTSLRQTATDQLLTLLPIVQRLPRRLDRITAAMERGTLSANVRLFADERDARLVSRLVSRAVLAFQGAAIGLMAVLLLGLRGGPRLSTTLSVYELFGYCALFVSVVLMLRVLVAIARERTG